MHRKNLPSGVGMAKAGFTGIGQLSFRADGVVRLTTLQMPERARAGASLLNIPLLEDKLSPCWRGMDKVVCTCPLLPETCSYVIELRHSAQTSS